VKRFWIIIAGILAAGALVLFIRGDYDKAFISAALGGIGWFLSYRVQLRTLIKDDESFEEAEDDLESDEEEQT
jgi:hypothetical protein